MQSISVYCNSEWVGDAEVVNGEPFVAERIGDLTVGDISAMFHSELPIRHVNGNLYYVQKNFGKIRPSSEYRDLFAALHSVGREVSLTILDVGKLAGPNFVFAVASWLDIGLSGLLTEAELWGSLVDKCREKYGRAN